MANIIIIKINILDLITLVRIVDIVCSTNWRNIEYFVFLIATITNMFFMSFTALKLRLKVFINIFTTMIFVTAKIITVFYTFVNQFFLVMYY